MSSIEKKIGNNRTITYDYIEDMSYVSETYIENNSVTKQFQFSKGSDYGLDGYTSDDNITELTFEFDVDHPLYMPFFHMLNYDDELIIDDDSTREDCKKYLSISKRDNKIYLEFFNKLEDNFMDSSFNKFYIFIKNIMSDGRSKIDSGYKDTKDRLHVFFGEAYKAINEVDHQITVEEYLLKNNYEVEELAKVFKKQYKPNWTRN